MSDIVSIVSFKFICVQLLGEFTFPELESLIHRQPNAFQEKAELQSAEVLEMMLILQNCEQTFHTWRETLPRVVVEVL